MIEFTLHFYFNYVLMNNEHELAIQFRYTYLQRCKTGCIKCSRRRFLLKQSGGRYFKEKVFSARE